MARVIMKSTGSGREGKSIDKMDVLNKFLDFFFLLKVLCLK